jgi:hypothetical protein
LPCGALSINAFQRVVPVTLPEQHAESKSKSLSKPILPSKPLMRCERESDLDVDFDGNAQPDFLTCLSPPFACLPAVCKSEASFVNFRHIELLYNDQGETNEKVGNCARRIAGHHDRGLGR